MNVTTDVLAVLSTCLRFDDWDRVVITQKLERGLYVKVAKVLECCGGNWNRKAKAHIFFDEAAPDFTPEERIEQVITTGVVKVVRDDLAFFPTPAPLASRLVELADVRADMPVLEPSAGRGAIVDALLARAARITCVERDVAMNRYLCDRYQGSGLVEVVRSVDDFMAWKIMERFQRVVMNPPFKRIGIGDHLDHVRHAHGMLLPIGLLVAVMPSSVTFRQDLRHVDFRAWVRANDGDITDLPPGSFKASGTGVNTCVVTVRR